MTLKYLDKVKDIAGDRGVLLLEELFEITRDSIEGIDADRFRADHADDMELLDNLSNTILLTDKYSNNKFYRPTIYSLPLINHVHSAEILEQANQILEYLQSRYKKELGESILISEIANVLEKDYFDIVETFLYMDDAHGWSCGHSLPFPFGEDFPNDEGAKIITCETLLRYSTFGEIITQFYKWHFINPQKESDSWVQEIISENKRTSIGFFDRENGIPGWYKNIDDTKKALISEISIALDNDLSALPTIGLRTLIETVMVDKVGNEGGFAKKLLKFQKAGHITTTHAQLLEIVLDAGSAAIHRAHFPNKEDIKTCVEVVEYLMQGIYILDPKVRKLSDNTPKRDIE